MSREVFSQASDFFVQVASQVTDEQWNMPALGEWTVRDLTGHTRNVLVGIKNNSATPAESLDIERSVDYFVRAWEGRYDPKAGAERGRQFGKALGSDPIQAIRESARSVLDYLNGLPDDLIINSPIGGIRLVDYIPTRIFELTVHSLDIAAAIGVDAGPPKPMLSITLHLLADMAIEMGQGSNLTRGLSGRDDLPTGFSLVG